MGRPPLSLDKLKDPTVKTTIRLPTSLLGRVDQAAGDGKSAAFIREAIEEKLERHEAAAPKPKTKPTPNPPSPSKEEG